MQFDFLKDNIIVVCSNSIKLQIIEYCISNKQLFNIKYMSMKEIVDALTFCYDEKTIVGVMDQYNVSYSNARMYLDNIKYIDENISDDRLAFLNSIKNFCISNNLLKSDDLLTSVLKEKEVYILDNYIGRFENDLLEKNKINYKFLSLKHSCFKHTRVYEFNSLEDEIHFVANQICKLINDGIDINKISLVNVDKDSDYIINRIFKMYNLPYNEQFTSSIYETNIGKYFLDNINSDINVSISLTKERFGANDIINSIIDILNRFYFITDFCKYKDILIEEFKKAKIKKLKIRNVVSVKNLDDIFNDDEYVFLIGFNLGVIPRNFKDEDYISDNIKSDVVETTVEKNKTEKERCRNSICSIKNLTISYKLNYLNEDFYPSNLIEEMELNTIKSEISISNYSELANKLVLGKDLDTYMQFGEKSNHLGKLLYNYFDIGYNSYSSKFMGIQNFDKIPMLSYSSMNNYYKCAFRYYLANILKIDIFNENFSQYVGNLFHHVLEVCLNNSDTDIDVVYDEYIQNNKYDFSEKNKFFLSNLKDEIKFIFETIKEQYSYSEYKDCFYEKEIEVNDDEIKFKGFIDKLLVKDDKMVIIDYKTGSIDINLGLADYGLSLQLPVYLYLARKLNKNAKIVGFYLQHILNSQVRRNNKKSFVDLKKDALKLQGYSLGNENYLVEFDSSFRDSKVIKSMKMGNNGFYAYSKVLTEKEIDGLVNLVDKKIKEASKSIKNGEFPINPKVIGKVNEGCAFCKFKDICFLSENDKVYLNEIDDLSFLGGDGNA